MDAVELVQRRDSEHDPSLIEVGPELKGHLSGITQRPWRLPLLVAAAGLILMGVVIFALVTAPHLHR
jgi:hypothetical protein